MLLKQISELSNEAVCEHWVHPPIRAKAKRTFYSFGPFCGKSKDRESFSWVKIKAKGSINILPAKTSFNTRSPRSSLSHWRKRLGDRLEESLRVGLETGAIRPDKLTRITVYGSAQNHHPSNRFYSILLLVWLRKNAARFCFCCETDHRVPLSLCPLLYQNQSSLWVGKKAQIMVVRYAHTRQFNNKI